MDFPPKILKQNSLIKNENWLITRSSRKTKHNPNFFITIQKWKHVLIRKDIKYIKLYTVL